MEKKIPKPRRTPDSKSTSKSGARVRKEPASSGGPNSTSAKPQRRSSPKQRPAFAEPPRESSHKRKPASRESRGNPRPKDGETEAPVSLSTEGLILPESEAFLQLVLAHAPGIVAVVDHGGTLLFINRTVTGRPVEGIVGRSVFDFTDVDSHPHLREALSRVFDRNEADAYESTGIGPGDTKAWYSTHLAPIRRGGEVVAALLFSMDVTARKTAERDLRESREKYRLLAEHSQEGITIAQGSPPRAVLANAAMGRLVGMDGDEFASMSGRDILDLVYPDDRPMFLQRFKDRLEGKPVEGRHIFRARHKDGSLRSIEIRASVIEHEGKPALHAVFSDVTEQRKMEDALRRSEETVRGLLDSTHDLAVLVDTDGKIIVANEAWYRRLGQTPELAVGKRVYDLFPSDLAQDRRAVANEVILSGRPVDMEEMIGAKTMASRIYPLFDAGGKVERLAVFARDITEQRRAEERLRESEEKYRTLVDRSLQGVAIARGDPIRIVFVNQAMVDILRHNVEDLRAFSPEDLFAMIHPDDRGTCVQRFKDRLEGKPVPGHYDLRIVRRDGSQRWVEMSADTLEYEGVPAVQVVFVDITERKEAEAALRNSEEMYRTLMGGIRDGVYTLDRDGRFTYVNDVITARAGRPKEWFLGRSYLDVIQPKDRAETKKNFEAILRGEKVPIYEVTYETGTESLLWVELNTTSLYHNGELIGLLGVSRDINPRRQAEEALRRSEERFSALVADTSDLIGIASLDGTVQYLSPAARKILGYEPDRLLGKNALDIVHPEDAGTMRDILSSVAEKPGSSAAATHRLQAGDGSWVWIETIVGNQLENPGIQGIIINSRDISDRMKTQELRDYYHRMDEQLSLISGRLIHPANFDEALRDTLRDLGGLLRVERACYCRLGRDGRTMNVAFEWTDSGAKPHSRRVDLESMEWLAARLRRNEAVIVSKVDELPAPEREALLGPEEGARVILPILVDGNLRGMLGVADPDPGRTWEAGEVRFLRSVADFIARAKERIRAESDKTHLQEKIYEARRIQSLAILAGGIAQDFNDLLFTLKATATLLRREIGEKDGVLGHLERVEETSERMKRLVEQLQIFGGKIFPEARRVRPNDIVEAAIRAVSDRLPAGARVVRTLLPDVHEVLGDSEYMKGVFINILANSVEAVGEGGEIRVRTGNVAQIPFAGAAAGGREGPYVHVHVADNGCGMSSHILTHCLEPFVTTKHIGRGLGLAEAYGVIKHYRGSIFIDSEPEHGTNVHVYMPAEALPREPARSGKAADQTS